MRTADVLSTLRRHDRRRGGLGPASAKFQEWCRQRELPAALQDHFASCSVHRAGFSFGPGFLFGEENIMRSEADQPALLAARLLHVGDCPNGDMIVLDLSEESIPVGFVSHEQLLSPHPQRPRAAYVKVADGLFEFLKGWADEALPLDYFAATGGT